MEKVFAFHGQILCVVILIMELGRLGEGVAKWEMGMLLQERRGGRGLIGWRCTVLFLLLMEA